MERTKLAVAIVTVAVVVLLVLLFLGTSSAEPSAAEKLALTASDLDPEWKKGIAYDGSRALFQRPGLNSFVDFRFYNQTDNIMVSVLAYNSTAECRAVYEQVNSNFQESRDRNNYTAISIGDAGFYGWEKFDSIKRFPVVCFMDDSVLCFVKPMSGTDVAKPWALDSALYIAEQQAEKISRGDAGVP